MDTHLVCAVLADTHDEGQVHDWRYVPGDIHDPTGGHAGPDTEPAAITSGP